MSTLAASTGHVPASRIRELANTALGMEGVLRLYFGESSLSTPDYIKAAVGKALEEGYTFYTENAGLPGLREELARMYERLHGITLDWQREIMVTASGVQALNVGIRCIIDPGDEALVLAPTWPNAAAIIRMFHGTPIDIPLRFTGSRYRVDFEALEAAVTSHTRLLVFTSPSNPLGWVASPTEQAGLLEFARRHHLWLLADEVYERLYYAGPALGVAAPSILTLASRDDAVLVTQSFSKTYCMTGWRLGWLVSRRDLIARATTLNEFIVSHAPSFIQRAAQTALADGEAEIRTMLVRLRDNRDFCLAALRRLPRVTVPEPDGAFYLFPRIEGLTDSFTFCVRLLQEGKVGLAPGVAFGAGGEGSVRLCYAAERPILEQAMERLGQFLVG